MNSDFRVLLERHMRDWRIIDTPDRLTVEGWLKDLSVHISVSGLHGDVEGAIDALVKTMVLSGRVKG